MVRHVFVGRNDAVTSGLSPALNRGIHAPQMRTRRGQPLRTKLRYFRRVRGRTKNQRNAREQIVADFFEIDVPELDESDFALASIATDAAFAAVRHPSLKETFWHDGRHWGRLKSDLSVTRDDTTYSWAMQEALSQRIYAPSVTESFIKGNTLAPSEQLFDVTEDHSDEDFALAVTTAQEMFRFVGEKALAICNEPLLSVKVDNRPLKGQDQGFKAWLPVETVLARVGNLAHDRMYFRLDQMDMLREIAGNARLKDFDKAFNEVRFVLDDTYVQDVWTISALGYLERRVQQLSIQPWAAPPSYMETLQELNGVMSREIDEETISEAFDLVAKMDQIAPAAYDTRWLVKESFSVHVAHWETRPIGPVVTPLNGARP
nr:hypothetical protein [Neorhizobium tomejilense]